MQRSTFTGANLADVDFTKAELGRADFGDADHHRQPLLARQSRRADFRTAKFTGALDFTSAFFFLTRIDGSTCPSAVGLAQWQIDMACGTAKTVLPAGLKPGASWPCHFE